MAIDGGPIGQVEVVRDGASAVPVDEQLFDGLSFGVIANGALAPMTLEIRRPSTTLRISDGCGGWDGARIGAKTPLDLRGSRS
ncbi:MAG TPA: hypothetical protein VGR72_10810 [Candidatus Acidoferrales bacterium]|nr:hypothetical protein [Candidatus Acidoferrales bacterium]